MTTTSVENLKLSIRSNVVIHQQQSYMYNFPCKELPQTPGGADYLLLSLKDRSTAVGSNDNVRKALKRQNSSINFSQSTRQLRPWALIAMIVGFPIDSAALRDDLASEWYNQIQTMSNDNQQARSTFAKTLTSTAR